MSGTIFCLRKSNGCFGAITLKCSFSTQVTKLLILKSANIRRMYTNKKTWGFTIQGLKNSPKNQTNPLQPLSKLFKRMADNSLKVRRPWTLFRTANCYKVNILLHPRLAQSCPLRSGLVVAVDSLRLIFPVILSFSVY